MLSDLLFALIMSHDESYGEVSDYYIHNSAKGDDVDVIFLGPRGNERRSSCKCIECNVHLQIGLYSRSMKWNWRGNRFSPF